MRRHITNPTALGWAFFFAGYIALLIADRLGEGMSERAFMAIIYALMLPALFLLYRGTKGKGSTGLRVLIVITHFWLGYALAALIWLVF